MITLVQHLLGLLLPFLFVITLVVTVHEFGHFATARVLGIAVDRFSIGFGRSIVEWTDRWGVEWRIGWLPVGGYVRFSGDAEASSMAPDKESLKALRAKIIAAEGPGAERRYFHFKPVWQRALVVAAGPLANFGFAILLFAVLMTAMGEVVLVPRVGGVMPGSPAAVAGFRTGDLITRMDGARIGDFRDIRQFVALRTGAPIRFDVERAGRDVALPATPVRHAETDSFTNTSSNLGYLGVLSSTDRRDLYMRRYGPVEALGVGAQRTWGILATTGLYIERMARGRESGDQLSGPLRVAATADAVAKAGAEGATGLGGKLLGGLTALLSLVAVFSVGIGFVNLLPIPVLDGGHLVFYAYEALARRPMGPKVQGAGYRVGLALLLGFMLFATWNDLQQLRVFKFFGGLFS